MLGRRGSKTSSVPNARLVQAFVLALAMTTNAIAGESAEPKDVRLEVTDSGQYILSGIPVALADLRARLRELKSKGGPINLRVTGSPKVEYRFVMPAMQIVQEEGLAKLGLLTVPPAEPDSPASPSFK